MEHMRVRTNGGTFSLVGRLHLDRQRPCLLVVGGAFPPKGYLHDFIDAYPGANVLVANLPGMETAWTETTIPGMTRGLEQVAARFFGDQPLVLLGVSTGNLLGLGFTLPSLVEKVAVEPFLRTAHLRPFVTFAKSYMDRNPEATDKAAFLNEVFGVTPGGVTDRDYRYLAAQIRSPTTVIVGTYSLTDYDDGAVWPSFTSQDDRTALVANPNVKLEVALPHGHNPTSSGYTHIRACVLQALLRASKRCLQ